MARPREGYHDLFAQIPDPLWEALRAEAQDNERSTASQLVWILRQRYPDAIPVDKGAAKTKRKQPPREEG